MYTTTNKGFTVITNFGCDQNCKYCITKFHPILRGQISLEENIDWNYLEKCISEARAPEVNLSGGGDPFFEWEKHRDFYFRIHEIAKRNLDLGEGVMFLPDGDYHNYYFLHNNTLYPFFFGWHEEDRLNIPRIC